jgi:6-phospho-3-hexuloisomerase
MNSPDAYKKYSALITEELQMALANIDGNRAEGLASRIIASRKVFVVGVGRVMLSMQAFAKRLAHLGIDAHCVGEITEPAITSEDLLIAASGSGESIFPKEIARKAKSLGATVIHIGSNTESGMKPYCDEMLRIPTRTKLNLQGEIPSAQPMSSLFEQSLFILGDVIAMIIIEKKGLDMRSLWAYHANLE